MNILPSAPPRPGRRGAQNARGSQRDSHRVNHQIRISRILVIDQHGEKLGEMSPDEGRDLAETAGLDLVEVVPHARPPVCRIMDYGKYKYEESKKQRSRPARTEVKTITLRPKTDTHDLETKLGHARKFLKQGHRVKFVMRMRGREQAHIDMWEDKMYHIVSALDEIATVVQRPRLEGRTITAMVEPASSKNTKS